MYLSEFQRLCNERKPAAFVYDDANNHDHIPGYTRPASVCNPMKLCLAFDSIYIQIGFPASVSLLGKYGSLTLYNVKCVKFDGDVVTLYCENSEQKVAYTLKLQ